MHRERILFALFVALLVLTAFHFVGIANHFFWVFWWYDLVAHFLGGIVIGLGSAWLLFLRGRGHSMAFSLATIVLVGILWEGFEAYFKLTFFPFDFLDTVSDLSFDTLGGVVGVYFAKYLTRS
jgi:hypothetical protein